MKCYTGIGGRNTPQDILDLMARISIELEKQGWTLRSGGAAGADIYFEKGIKNQKMKEIYLPWKMYMSHNSPLHNVTYEAIDMAKDHHPTWDTLSDGMKTIFGSCVYQVLGYKLDKKSTFLICWTKDGCESHETRTINTGGTGVAISLASTLGVPVYNLANESSCKRIMDKLGIK